jgi:hypothetical protein
MAKKRVNQAIQAYEKLSTEDKRETTRLVRAMIWFERNGRCHALRNPNERY